MHRRPLLSSLDGYLWEGDAERLSEFRRFVEENPACFERRAPGHVTASALVVAPDLSRVLLTLHAKLGLWIQLGGHCDGDPDVPGVALREVWEESGLTGLVPLSPTPFDLDVLPVPGRPGEPAHLHYDVRYLVGADPAEPLRQTSESRDLRWFTLQEARVVAGEPTMQRMFWKLHQRSAPL